jgi:hypothetical protein
MNTTQKPSVTETPHDGVGNDSSDHGYDDADHDLRYPVFHDDRNSVQADCSSAYCAKPSTTYARNFAYLSPIFRASL